MSFLLIMTSVLLSQNKNQCLFNMVMKQQKNMQIGQILLNLVIG